MNPLKLMEFHQILIKKNTETIVYDIINSVENESETDNTSNIDMIAKSLSKNAVGKKTFKSC